MSAPKLMINPDLVPSPFTFNPLKHHLGFIRQLLEYAASGENEAEVINLINTIGPQLTDIYYGDFSVEYILEEIKSILLQLSCFKMESYEKWVEIQESITIYWSFQMDQNGLFAKAKKGEDTFIFIRPG
jgi:hypothetical protein